MILYFAETTTGEQRDLLCRWAEYFYDRGERVQIIVDSTPAAQFVDGLLWTFAQGSFVPHAIYRSRDDGPPVEPVLICTEETRVPGFGVVLCDVPVGVEFLRQFEKAVHFILRDDPEKKQESRLMWQAARDSGLGPVHIPYGSGAGEKSA